jgi:hypothetical protein
MGMERHHLDPAEPGLRTRRPGRRGDDSRAGQILLFGGQGPHQDTYPATVWTWDGSSWERNGCG